MQTVTARSPVPPFTAKGDIVGRLTRPRHIGRADVQEPIAGVPVWLEGIGPAAAVHTDRDGRFRVPGVDLTQVWPLRFGIGPDAIAPPIDVGLGSHAACGDVEVVARSNGWLGGQVVDRAGRPMAGLTVHAVATAFDWVRRDLADAASARTDATGSYAFEGLRPGRYVVSVNALDPPTPDHPYRPRFHPGAGARDAASPVNVEGGKPVRLQPLALGDVYATVSLPIQVRCRDGSTPALARVLVEAERRPVDSQAVPTGADGRAVLRALAGQRYLVSAAIFARSPGGVESDGVYTTPSTPVLADGQPVTVTAPLVGCAARGGPVVKPVR